MTEIKKVCHECKTPLTCSPYAASVPGELCNKCHDEKYNKRICDLCGKEEIISKPHTLSFINLPSNGKYIVCGDCISMILQYIREEKNNEQ